MSQLITLKLCGEAIQSGEWEDTPYDDCLLRSIDLNVEAWHNVDGSKGSKFLGIEMKVPVGLVRKEMAGSMYEKDSMPMANHIVLNTLEATALRDFLNTFLAA